MILLFGVAIFSFIMGELQSMIVKLENLDKDFNEESSLEKFFILITKFNGGLLLDQNIKDDIMEHFEYRWKNNNNNFITQPED